MRFVWAVAAFVLAAVMIGAGFAQRTIFLGPSTVTDKMPTSSSVPFILIDGAVLDSRAGGQTLRAQDSGELFAAYGKTSDMKAWLADTTFEQVSLDKAGNVTSKIVDPTTVRDVPAAGDSSLPPHSPIDSDLWLEDFQAKGVLSAPVNLKAGTSVLVATDGEQPAPKSVTVTWPLNNATPWAGPLIAGGILLLAVGVLLYFLAIRHVRRSRGPRRKAMPPLPATEPIDLSEIEADKGVISATPEANRGELAGRRAFAVIPVAVASALLFSGCSADAWPQFAQESTPTPSISSTAQADQKPPVVTEGQAGRILTRISKTVALADDKMDKSLAATRLDGAMLQDRLTNYVLRARVKGHDALHAIPSQPLEVVLPETTDQWPRAVLTVVSDPADKKAAPLMMLLTQQDVWSPYKLSYSAPLLPSTVLPFGEGYDSAVVVESNSQFLAIRPDQLASAYADFLDNGDRSPNAKLFDIPADKFRPELLRTRKQTSDDFNTLTKGKTGVISFKAVPGDGQVVAVVAGKKGAIVAVQVMDQVMPKSTKDGATVTAKGGDAKALLGKAAAREIQTTYGDQLFFFVPSTGSDEKIRLLGFTRNIRDSKVVK